MPSCTSSRTAFFCVVPYRSYPAVICILGRMRTNRFRRTSSVTENVPASRMSAKFVILSEVKRSRRIYAFSLLLSKFLVRRSFDALRLLRMTNLLAACGAKTFSIFRYIILYYVLIKEFNQDIVIRNARSDRLFSRFMKDPHG